MKQAHAIELLERGAGLRHLADTSRCEMHSTALPSFFRLVSLSD